MTELSKLNPSIFDHRRLALAIHSALLRLGWNHQTALHEIDDPENSVPNLECWGEIVAVANFYAKSETFFKAAESWEGLPDMINAYMVAESLFPCEYDYLEKLEQVMKEAA